MKKAFRDRQKPESTANLKNLKASNVQDPNEVLSWQPRVQLLVDAHHHPQEEFLIDRLGNGIHCLVHLQGDVTPVPGHCQCTPEQNTPHHTHIHCTSRP